MKIFTIIAGVNGAGKSSFTGVAEVTLDDFGVRIDPDKIAAELNLGALQGGKVVIKMINDCFEQGLNFTQETTLSGKKTKRTIQRAREMGYHIRLFYIGLNDYDDHTYRIKNRVARGGHHIPNDVVQRRYAQRFKSLMEILPLCDEVVLYDNDNGFVEGAEYVNGEQLRKNGHSPQWLAELEEYICELDQKN